MTYKAMKPKVIASIVLFNHSYDDIKDTLLSLCHEESVEKIIFVDNGGCQWAASLGNDSNLLIVFYVQIVPDDFVMQLHR
ncbi:hypothetical protein R1K48_28570, partial [Klebsiella sp. 103027]